MEGMRWLTVELVEGMREDEDAAMEAEGILTGTA